MNGHMPGPWRAVPGDGCVTIYGPLPDTELIATVEGGNQTMDAANGRLIAAAPDLLEALKAIAWDADYWLSFMEPKMREAYTPVLEKARDAIAKAVRS